MAVTRQRRARLYREADAFLAAVENRHAEASDRMLAAWADTYRHAKPDLDALLEAIAREARTGPVPVSWLNRQRRLEALLATVRNQFGEFARYASREAVQAARDGLDAGLTDSRALVQSGTAAMARALEQADRAGAVDLRLYGVNPGVLSAHVGLMGDGTVVTQHLARTLAPEAADAIRTALFRGLAEGWGIDRMRHAATRTLAVPQTRATTILRTEALRTYRTAAQATYVVNSHVVGSWVWTSALDRRTCAACVVMHGTVHDLDETLDGHPRCRCAMVPRTKSWAELGAGDGLEDTRPWIEPGTEWFAQQAADAQAAILGPAKFKAWRAGDLDLDDVVARKTDPNWGTMRLERSLVAIAEGRDANPRPTRLHR